MSNFDAATDRRIQRTRHALLVTLILLFSSKGEVIVSNPLTILWIAIPLLIQTSFIFFLAILCFREGWSFTIGTLHRYR